MMKPKRVTNGTVTDEVLHGVEGGAYSTMTQTYYLLDGINPVPWTASQASTGRKDGKLHTSFFKNAGLDAFQKLVKEELQFRYPDLVPLNPDEWIGLDFWLCRQLEETEHLTRKGRRNWADATNMQKALEDACQGVLFPNDSRVRNVRTMVVEQGPDVEPCILIRVTTLPDELIREQGLKVINDQRTRQRPRQHPDAPAWTPPDNLF